MRNFVSLALPERLEENLDPKILQAEESYSLTEKSTCDEIRVQHQIIKECLVSVLRIGIACSEELPQERMVISDIVARLCHVREMLVNVPKNKHAQPKE